MLKPSRNKYSIAGMLQHFNASSPTSINGRRGPGPNFDANFVWTDFFMKQELFGNRNNINHAANNYPNTPHISRYSRTPHVLLVPCNDG